MKSRIPTKLATQSRESIAVFVICGAYALVGCRSDPQPSDFHVGMSRQEIVAEFGEPDGRQTLVKSESHVWGPIETFWPSVPSGAEVEIWFYSARGGRVELYFVDGSSKVQGTGFAPEGAVF